MRHAMLFSVRRGVTSVLARMLVLQLAANPLSGVDGGVVSECSAGSCADCLDAATSRELEALITSEPVVLVAIPNMRCTVAAQAKLSQCGIEAAVETFTPADIDQTWSNFQTEDAKWRYMDCRYHTEQGGMTMHSWVFVGGELLGDGFDIMQLDCSALASGGAEGAAHHDDGLRRLR